MAAKVGTIRILYLAMCLVLAVTSGSGGKTYVVFRYDDLSADAPGARDADPVRRAVFEAEKAVDGLFLRFGLPYVVAVIPAGHSEYAEGATGRVSLGDDPEKVLLLRQAIAAQRVEIALHGYRHENHVKDRHRPAEFRERNVEQQLEDIRNGKEILQQALGRCEIVTFVPPWNSWDDATVLALRSAEFKVLSADCRYSATSLDGLTVVPFTCQLWELESLLDEGLPDRDSLIVVLFHPPQLVPMNVNMTRFFGVPRFEGLLEKLSRIPSVEVMTFSGLLAEGVDLGSRRYQLAHDLDRLAGFWEKLLPRHLAQKRPYRFEYVEVGTYARQIRFWGLLTAAFVAGLVSVGLAVGGLVNWAIGRKGLYLLVPLGLCGLAASILKEVSLIVRGYHATGISAIPGLVAVGILAACGLGILRRAFARPKQQWPQTVQEGQVYE